MGKSDLAVVLIALYSTCVGLDDDHTLDFILIFLIFTLRPLILISSHPPGSQMPTVAVSPVSPPTPSS